MKTIKPAKLGLLTRCFEHDRKVFLSASVMACFPLNQPDRLLSEQEMWAFLPEALGDPAVLDDGLPKQNGEFLVWGSCFCPKSRPRMVCPVTVKVGSASKSLLVFGDRSWHRKAGIIRATDPEPFTAMPVVYENAFGGRDYALNPKGKGYAPVLAADDTVVHPLLNIEWPDRLVGSPEDRPEPAGFGPLDFTWPQRFEKAGTYDQKWFETRFPGFASDMDWTIFNAASPDQWVKGFFKGDEPVTLENLHPEKSVLQSKLPGLAARVFVNLRADGGETFLEVPTRLDTVCLFPNQEKGVVIFRAVTQIKEDDAEDVLHILAAGESLEEPRPLEYYRQQFQKRIDKEKGYLYALRDQDLLPPQPEPLPGIEAAPELADLGAGENLLRQNLRKRTEADLEAAREELRAKGLEPSLYIPDSLPPDEPFNVDHVEDLVREAEIQTKRARKEGERLIAQKEAELRDTLTKLGLDYDQVMLEARKMAGGRPKFKAAEAKEQLLAAAEQVQALGVSNPELERLLAAPDLDEKLAGVEKTLQESYQRYGHHFPPVFPFGVDEARQLGEAAEKDHRAGQSLEARDLTGADLSGMDLKKAGLRNAFLEGANLSGTNMSKADLSGAVLVRVKAAGVILSQASLQGVNLAQSDFSGARLDGGADLTRATLAETNLTGANLTGARLGEAELTDAELAGVNFSQAVLAGALFQHKDLAGVCFRGADLSGAKFIGVDVSGLDFEGANLTSATFVNVKADRAVFTQANLHNFRGVGTTSMAAANFSSATMTGANLRGLNLEEACFREAVLEEADLSSAQLKGADLYRAKAKGIRMIRADLEGASLVAANLWGGNFQKARLFRADFTGANLYEANFLKSKADKKTIWTDALFTRAVFMGQSGK